MPGMAGNAAAPAARCMNARRGNFMMLPPQFLLRLGADLQFNCTPCESRLHPTFEEAERANPSPYVISLRSGIWSLPGRSRAAEARWLSPRRHENRSVCARTGDADAAFL